MKPTQDSIEARVPETESSDSPTHRFPSVRSLSALVLVLVVLIGIAFLFSLLGTGPVPAAADDTFGLPAIEPVSLQNIKNEPYLLKNAQPVSPEEVTDIGYFHFEGSVYLSAGKPSESPTPITFPVSGADIDTFVVLTTNPELTKHLIVYAKDKNHVYYGQEPLGQADPGTFEVLGIGFESKDESHVFSGRDILTTADPASFRVTASGLTIDKNALYCGSGARRIEVPDSSALELVAQNKLIALSKDGNSVYNSNTCEILGFMDEAGILQKADPASIVVKGNFAYDSVHVFFLGDPNTPFLMQNPKVLPGTDGSTFKQTGRAVGDKITITAEDAQNRYEVTFDLKVAGEEFQQWQFSREKI